jgi:NADH dehydrogenase
MKVLVTGGSGFVGRHVVRALRESGHEVRILTRGRTGIPAGVEHVAGDVTDPEALARAVSDVDAVVHLVAIIVERGPRTFERVNHVGTRNIVEAMSAAGVRRLIHLSALGAGPDQRFPYLRSKWQGEEAVRRSTLDWTILCPSVLHGEGAGFFRPIVWSLRWMPFYPMVAGGRTRFQPLAIRDLAECMRRCLDGAQVGSTLDVGGPEVLTFSDIVRIVMETLGKRRRVVPMPVWSSRPFAFVQELRRDPLVTNEQLDMVVLDNTCSAESVSEAFGFDPVRFIDTDRRWLAKL